MTHVIIQDVHTAVWILNKCLKGDLLRERTVLLVTHNVALVAPLATFVVSMGTDGRVLAVGTPAETVFQDQVLAEQVAHEQATLELEDELQETPADDAKASTQGAKLVVAEEVQRGSVGWDVLKLYFGSLSRAPVLYAVGCFVFAACVLRTLSRKAETNGAFRLSEGSSVGQYWWLGRWAHAYEKEDDVNAGRSVFIASACVEFAHGACSYLGLYFAITMVTLFTYCFLVILYMFGSVRSSRVVHTRLMASLFASTFRSVMSYAVLTSHLHRDSDGSIERRRLAYWLAVRKIGAGESEHIHLARKR
jgi:hypothetical protein